LQRIDKYLSSHHSCKIVDLRALAILGSVPAQLSFDAVFQLVGFVVLPAPSLLAAT
jgi:hypothetical protein